MSTSPNINLDPGAPFSQEAEEAVIGSILIDPDAYIPVVTFLKPDDFFLLRHKTIWQALEHLASRDEPIDHITLAEELENMQVLDEIGGRSYLIQLANNTGTSMYAEVYARLVERTSIRRKLMIAADEIKKLAMDEALNIDTVVSDAESKLFTVTETQIKRDFVPMWDALSIYYDRMEYMLKHRSESVGVPTGFRDLDTLLGGFQKSDLLVFAGRPGMGKTSWLLTTAMNVARLGGRVAIFTMEMGVEQMVQRMVAMETGINVQKLRLAQLTPQEAARFTEAVGRISDFPIFIDDSPAISPMEMRTKSRRLKHEHGLDMIMVDYMQLMNSGGSYENNRVQEISYISRALKELARELNVPLISAAQLSRAVEQRQDKRPVLSDLRESGCLTGDSLVYLPDCGYCVPIADLMGKTGFSVVSLNTETWKTEIATVTNSFCTGVKPVFRMTTALGRTIGATGSHKFMTIEGWKRLDELTEADHIAVPRSLPDQPQQTAELVAGFATDILGDAVAPRIHKEPAGATALYKSNLSRDHPTRVAELVQSKALENLANSDIYWDKIASIEPDGEEAVYDLTVEPNHSFICDNIAVSNSIEQDSDIVMFLYRDEVYNDATEFPNQADIIIAKHRNGPTGVVSLYFEKSLTKFMDASVHRVDLSDLE
jgi:replicative DNA helicase